MTAAILLSADQLIEMSEDLMVRGLELLSRTRDGWVASEYKPLSPFRSSILNGEAIRVLILAGPEMTSVVRQGLRGTLDIEIVAEVTRGTEALKLFKRLRPSVAVIDIDKLAVDAFLLTAEICKQHPDARIILCGARCDYTVIRRAILSGAKDCIALPEHEDDLVDTIRRLGELQPFADGQEQNEKVAAADYIQTTDRYGWTAGGVSKGLDGRHTIIFDENADIYTFMKSSALIFADVMHEVSFGEQRRAFCEWAELPPDLWTIEHRNAFAEAMMYFLAHAIENHEPLSPKVMTALEKLGSPKTTKLSKPLSPAVRRIFVSMFGG